MLYYIIIKKSGRLPFSYSDTIILWRSSKLTPSIEKFACDMPFINIFPIIEVSNDNE